MNPQIVRILNMAIKHAKHISSDFLLPRAVLASVVVSVALLQLGGCSTALHWEEAGSGKAQAPTTVKASDTAARGTSTGQTAANTATSMIGVPYRYGGATPNGFDCSGLVQYSFDAAGKAVPRTSREQFKAAQPIDLVDAKPGDLLFFRYDRKISHVAIYLGDLRFVHAPSSGKTVSVASLETPHYREHFVQAGRL